MRGQVYRVQLLPQFCLLCFSPWTGKILRFLAADAAFPAIPLGRATRLVCPTAIFWSDCGSSMYAPTRGQSPTSMDNREQGRFATPHLLGLVEEAVLPSLAVLAQSPRRFAVCRSPRPSHTCQQRIGNAPPNLTGAP